jgi:hypothetical protein
MESILSKLRHLTITILLVGLASNLFAQNDPASNNSLPVAWSTYQKVASYEQDFADLKAHGVGLVDMNASNVADAKEKLKLARQYGMKYHIELPEITERANLVQEAGFKPVDALMIGGVYQGKAIDRHLFKFKAGKNKILLEPPVYNKAFAYTANNGSTSEAGLGDRIAHYYPDMGDPLKAEIVVPLKIYDGKQHLKILNATISKAPEGSKPEFDSVTPDMPVAPETKNRQLYQLSFDLTGLDAAMLDQVGIAVYWPYQGTKKYWLFGRGNVSSSAPSTKLALQKLIQKELAKWTEANNGTFPSDVVVAARYGDECFYITGHSQTNGSAAVSYPLWEYSAPTIEAFHKQAGETEYPRTWGFPEIYGEDAYGWWMYNLHEQTANLVGVVHDEIAKTAPGLKLFRNTTRMGIFDLSNNIDGSGQELLTRKLDIVHLDPYPVVGGAYNEAIPRDMSYCSGLARRYNKLLIPWMQAHVYAQLQNVNPEQVGRMAQEQWDQGVDGIIWLGYGDTYPNVRPDSWERAAEFHKRLTAALPTKPQAKLAVLRSYNKMATASIWENGQIRNPADWLLQQFLEVWAVQRKQSYDVFEIPPMLTATERTNLENQLKKYTNIVSTLPWPNAWVIGDKQIAPIIDQSKATEYQQKFEKEINQRGWSQENHDLNNWLKNGQCKASARFTHYDYNSYNKPLAFLSLPVGKPNTDQEVKFLQGKWQFQYRSFVPADRSDALDVEFSFKLIEGSSPQTSIGIDFTFNNWSKSNYVLMPGATYNGNRFESRRIRYSPKLLDSRDIGPEMPMIISDVPRLNINDGPSRIQERSGTMSVPSIGFQADSAKKGFWLLTYQGTKYGDNGIGIEESRDRKTTIISLTVPVVRENYQYFIADNQAASMDKAPDFKAGDEFTIRFRLYNFPSPVIQGLYDRFAEIRKDISGTTALKPFVPFSSCFSVQEAKFNEQNWEKEHGYYSVGMRENFLQDWQIGWTGGMISTYPLLFAGNETSKANVIRNFDWLFPNGICPAGFFWDSGEKGTKWYGGDIRKPNTKNWHLIRKSGDGLYYILKQFQLMKLQNIQPKPEWEKGTQTVADAFVRLWGKWGQFGQFVDSQTGDVVVGGSTSGAIVPAALILAAKYFNNPEYQRVALASAESYYHKFVKKGITSGGPGDAMQNPDSESSYAMLESFTLLYESTLDKKWLQRSEEMANQFSTWVIPYDYIFPANSALGKLGVQTTGVVGANTQNRHGAPGICTHSGIALWRLFRATGNVRYLQLLKEIAFVMPQYLSHPLRPIEKMKIGWMSERVSTTDWLEGIGELMYGSTWAETSLMLSYIELPGVYIQPDKSLLYVIDHIEAQIIQDKPKTLVVKLSNPTSAEAKVRLYVESSEMAKKPLGENALWNGRIINLKPGESTILKLKK